MAAMRTLGWISAEKPAGRDRMAHLRIDVTTVLVGTARYWTSIGPDFAARMSGMPKAPPSENVMPLRQKTVSIRAKNASDWPVVARLL